MSTYEDRSYPPIGKQLRYQRGDGAVVTLQIDPPLARAAAPVSFAELARTQATPDLNDLPNPNPAPMAPVRQLLDTPMTAFICFRANSQLPQQKACLDSFLTTTQPDQLDVRVVMIGADNDTRKLVQDYIKEGFVSQAYVFSQNTDKFAAMARVFNDNACHITSTWVLWADDCVLADSRPTWFNETMQAITTGRNTHGAHLFGSKYGQAVSPDFRDWIKSAGWYKKKQLRNRKGLPDAAGTLTYFVQPQCFIVSREAIDTAQLPDPRANDQCGAAIIGEQIHQAGFSVRQFNNDGQLLRCLDKPSIAGSWPVPGSKNYAPGYCGDWYRLVEGPPTIPVTTIHKAEAPVEQQQPAAKTGEYTRVGKWTVFSPPPIA
jgi:hypothetical protein